MECMHCTVSMSHGKLFFPLGIFSSIKVFNNNSVGNTPLCEEYLTCMPGLIPEFRHNATMFERLPLPSEPPYVVIGA